MHRAHTLLSHLVPSSSSLYLHEAAGTAAAESDNDVVIVAALRTPIGEILSMWSALVQPCVIMHDSNISLTFVQERLAVAVSRTLLPTIYCPRV